jgi:mono/diheme cytochrome c family protein
VWLAGLALSGPLLATAGAPPVGVTPAAEADYMLNCMGCHLADGSGAPGKVPSLRSSLVPLAMSAAGRRYLVQVPGAAQSTLTDLELAQVLNWMVRHLGAAPAPAAFADFSAGEVARYRRMPLVEVHAARAALLPGAASTSANRGGS